MKEKIENQKASEKLLEKVRTCKSIKSLPVFIKLNMVFRNEIIDAIIPNINNCVNSVSELAFIQAWLVESEKKLQLDSDVCQALNAALDDRHRYFETEKSKKGASRTTNVNTVKPAPPRLNQLIIEHADKKDGRILFHKVMNDFYIVEDILALKTLMGNYPDEQDRASILEKIINEVNVRPSVFKQLIELLSPEEQQRNVPEYFYNNPNIHRHNIFNAVLGNDSISIDNSQLYSMVITMLKHRHLHLIQLEERLEKNQLNNSELCKEMLDDLKACLFSPYDLNTFINLFGDHVEQETLYKKLKAQDVFPNTWRSTRSLMENLEVYSASTLFDYLFKLFEPTDNDDNNRHETLIEKMCDHINKFDFYFCRNEVNFVSVLLVTGIICADKAEELLETISASGSDFSHMIRPKKQLYQNIINVIGAQFPDKLLTQSIRNSVYEYVLKILEAIQSNCPNDLVELKVKLKQATESDMDIQSLQQLSLLLKVIRKSGFNSNLPDDCIHQENFQANTVESEFRKLDNLVSQLKVPSLLSLCRRHLLLRDNSPAPSNAECRDIDGKLNSQPPFKRSTPHKMDPETRRGRRRRVTADIPVVATRTVPLI